MEKLRETNVFSHHPLQPSLTYSIQDPLSEDRDMKDAIIIRKPLMVSKLPYDAVWGVVRAMAKPNQRTTIIFEDTVDRDRNAPPFHYPLDIQGVEMPHELGKLIQTHLSMFGPMVTIILRKVLTKRNSGGMKQSKPFI